MTRFLLSVHHADVSAIQTLLAGLSVHSDADAFPVWIESDEIPTLLYKLLPHLKDLSDTWVVTLETDEALTTFTHLLTSIEWKEEQLVYLASDDARKRWTLAQFHKAVFVDKEFSK